MRASRVEFVDGLRLWDPSNRVRMLCEWNATVRP